ncbi:PQQ-dependent sugar dehydrogenase [candidate division KSB1 bacterium]|nr:PQQ-dependent sugar dehydrogenase [candidate division KSB1 bacterium]
MRTNKSASFILLTTLLFSLPLFSTENNDVILVKAFPNLSFNQPLFLTHSNDGCNRIFVVQQDGFIKVFENSPQVTKADTFLNIQNTITTDIEMGLLGLAFHPNFANNDSFYINYTVDFDGSRRSVIARYTVMPGQPNQADPNSERILLEINQPFVNHNGGMLQFGPDGYLYIGLGDGGGSGDPLQHGQDRTTLLGSILRINIDSSSANLKYAIPADNPFPGNTEGFREEVFAWGLRNPWRFSIDFETGQIWGGDVGQRRIEEVNLIQSGKNYGWRTMEGTECFNPDNFTNPLSACDTTGLVLPIKEHPRNVARSITGGYIYRGTDRPELSGAYIYGDFETRRIWILRYENGQVTADSLLLNTNLFILSFGIDGQNELYILDYFAGEIYKFEATPATGIDDPNQPEPFQLAQNYPNPFNPTTTISYRLEKTARVELTIYNTAGQKVTTLLDEKKQAGEYQVKWQGKNDSDDRVASDVYFYKFQADVIQTRKMILLR